MFSTKTTTLLATLFLSASVLAAPPACVIGAVNTQTNPHDVASVCRADGVQEYINKNCGNAQEAAQKYFSEVCKGAGVTVGMSLWRKKLGIGTLREFEPIADAICVL
jgi:hypothetical protein